jgi:hypothetical protein
VPELGPLGWQPALFEVGPEGDPFGCPVVAVVIALDQLGEELLGLLAGAAACVPAVALAAGGLVDALVNDGVVTVALLGDVTSHHDLLVPWRAAWCGSERGSASSSCRFRAGSCRVMGRSREPLASCLVGVVLCKYEDRLLD